MSSRAKKLVLNGACAACPPKLLRRWELCRRVEGSTTLFTLLRASSIEYPASSIQYRDTNYQQKRGLYRINQYRPHNKHIQQRRLVDIGNHDSIQQRIVLPVGVLQGIRPGRHREEHCCIFIIVVAEDIVPVRGITCRPLKQRRAHIFSTITWVGVSESIRLYPTHS